MGKTLHHESMGRKGVVAALARRLYHILINKGTEDNMLYNIWRSKAWTGFIIRDIFK